MDRIGHIWRVKPGCAAEYDRRHAEIWPELTQLFHSVGVREYHIYRWDEILFSHMEVDDYDYLVARYDGNPVAARWEAEMADLVEYPNGAATGGWADRLHHVWSLPAPPRGFERPRD
jgi:L-rhamnose mutarotase